ncbi:hypothetical protein [Pseudomonas chlororaphis]|uniref:hypothetical protein n=1 Tax=Pseudomonas chlororaphis TaxID=587753 RepID=UPI0011DD069F|nr:hypothetical protein [Pseudomonas chlororaphis]
MNLEKRGVRLASPAASIAASLVLGSGYGGGVSAGDFVVFLASMQIGSSDRQALCSRCRALARLRSARRAAKPGAALNLEKRGVWLASPSASIAASLGLGSGYGGGVSAGDFVVFWQRCRSVVRAAVLDGLNKRRLPGSGMRAPGGKKR